MKEIRTRILLEGEQEYREAMQRMRKETRAFREEVEQLNNALEKEAELLKNLR